MSDLENLFKKHPLGCEKFGEEWLQLWAALGRVLQKRAFIQHRANCGSWEWGCLAGTVEECIDRCVFNRNVNRWAQYRVMLRKGKSWNGTALHAFERHGEQ